MEKFFKNRMKDRLNRLDIHLLKEISLVLDLSASSKKNKTQIIDEICSVCFAQDEYEQSDGAIDYSLKPEEIFFNYPLNIGKFQDFSYGNEKNKTNASELNKVLVDYSSRKDYNESLVRASSKVIEYKIVGKDGKERSPEEFNELIAKERGVIKYYGFVEDFNGKLRVSTINSGEEYDISEDDLKRWNLELFDTVGFNRYWNNELNIYSTQIVSVNNRSIGDVVNRRKLELSNRVKPYNEFDFLGEGNICLLLSAVNPIRKGDRILVSTSENNGKRRIAMEIAKAFRNLGVCVFNIYPSSIVESDQIFEEVDKNATLIDSKAAPLAKLNKISIAFMRAKKFVEEGRDVVVILGDIDSCFENINNIVSLKSVQQKIKYIDSIFSFGGQYVGGGSMTIISIASGDDEILLEGLKSRVNFYAPLKDADTSLYPQVDLKKTKINSSITF